MKCQKCGKNEANTHITKIINGEKTEMYLCENCAAESGELASFNSGFENEFQNFFSGFFGEPFFGGSKAGLSAETAKRCPVCGSTVSDITDRGRFGCSDCYKTFADYLLGPLKQIHGGNRHTGKIPKRAGKGIRREAQIDKLQSDLNLAVMNQDFEKAAELRDKIKDLKANN